MKTGKDVWHVATNWIDHNRWTALAAAVLASVIGMQTGCESTTIFRGEKVNRAQLQQTLLGETEQLKADQAALNARAATLQRAGELAQSDIERQDARNQAILGTLGDLALSAATGGATTPTLVTGGVTLASILLGGGAMLDNRRKDKVISGRDKVSPTDS